MLKRISHFKNFASKSDIEDPKMLQKLAVLLKP
jgi:hypothetical protein